MFKTALMGCATLLWAGSAQAAVQTMTQTLSYTNETGSTYGELFDPSLGTLLSAHLSAFVSTDSYEELYLTNYGTDPVDVLWSWTSMLDVWLYINGSPAFGVGGDNSSRSHESLATVLPGQTTGSPSYDGASFSKDLDITYLTGFSQVGLMATGDIYYNFSYPNGGGLFQEGRYNPHPMTDATAILTFTYDDTPPVVVDPPITDNPSPVPEPATWLMMIAGFGLVGWSLRRRRGAFA